MNEHDANSYGAVTGAHHGQQQVERENRRIRGMMNAAPVADNIQVSGSHYKDMPIQPWALMEMVLTVEEFRGYLKGNIIKYAMRAGRKEGSDDAGKARHYMQKLKEVS